jgi:hypothetical protein
MALEMKAYLCTVLIELAEEEYDYWSEGADETFTLARRLNIEWDDKGNGNYLLGYTQVEPNAFPKFQIINKEGGI